LITRYVRPRVALTEGGLWCGLPRTGGSSTRGEIGNGG
jgi:hypothetical protein